MITYHVRSRYLVDIYNDMKSEKIILSPHFQRKLVWRLTHKVDFIKTILLGYPFPEIFLSRGTINLEDMSSTSSVVDGQQRLTSIRDYIDGFFDVEGRTFSSLTAGEKEAVLKYEIAIIDLDLASDDAKIKEIFQRLNRTFYALSAIEKMATEYASSEFMLIGKLLAGEMKTEESLLNIDPARVQDDPNLSEDFVRWANLQKVEAFHKYVLESEIFSKYEVSRQVHLMFVLNLIAASTKGYYNRNDTAKNLLEEWGDGVPDREDLVVRMEKTASLLNRIKPVPSEFWYSKSNSFTLFVELSKHHGNIATKSIAPIRDNLKTFAVGAPADYRQSAKEGVNNLRERTTRGKYVSDLLSTAVS
jgi:hypothetical protein